MKERIFSGQRRIAASTEAMNSESPVVIRTWGGFEIWLDSASEQAERTEARDLIYRFAVTSPHREFAIVRVEIPAVIQDSARAMIGPRLDDTDSLWHALAHDALSQALDGDPALFELGHVTVDSLNAEQLDLARRWREQQ